MILRTKKVAVFIAATFLIPELFYNLAKRTVS